MEYALTIVPPLLLQGLRLLETTVTSLVTPPNTSIGMAHALLPVTFPLLLETQPAIYTAIINVTRTSISTGTVLVSTTVTLLSHQIQTGGLNYCNQPCLSSQYYYNGQCVDSCEYPMKPSTADYGNSCAPPCNSSATYYYPGADQCGKDCPWPYVKQDGLYPFCMESNLAKFLTLTRIIHHARYLDVKFPPRANDFLARHPRNILPIRSEAGMPYSFKQKFKASPLPYVFERYHVPSSFLVNFWNDFISVIIALIIALLFQILNVSAWNFPQNRVTALIPLLKRLTQWNIPVVLIATNIDEMIIYASIQFRAALSNQAEKASLAICVIVFISAIVFLAGMIYLIRKIVGFSTWSSEDNSTRWPSVYIFTGAFRQDSVFTRLFYFIYILRIAFPAIIGSALISSPISQSVIYVAVSVSILTFIVWMKPITKKVNHVQLVILEALVLIVHACLLGLSVLNVKGKSQSVGSVILGDLIIIVNTLINAHAIIFLAIKVALQLRKIEVYKNKNSFLPSGAYLQILVIYIQQGAFGFEELLEDPISAEDSLDPQAAFVHAGRVKLRPPVETPEKKIFDRKKTRNLDLLTNIVKEPDVEKASSVGDASPSIGVDSATSRNDITGHNVEAYSSASPVKRLLPNRRAFSRVLFQPDTLQHLTSKVIDAENGSMNLSSPIQSPFKRNTNINTDSPSIDLGTPSEFKNDDGDLSLLGVNTDDSPGARSLE